MKSINRTAKKVAHATTTIATALVFILCFLMMLSEYNGSLLNTLVYYTLASAGLYASVRIINRTFEKHKISKALDKLVERSHD